jgi:hypothetical protein
VKEYAAGKVEFRNDAGGNVHSVVGKVSFDKQKLVDNINAMVAQIRKMKPQTSKGAYFKKVVLKGTMTPAVQLNVACSRIARRRGSLRREYNEQESIKSLIDAKYETGD